MDIRLSRRRFIKGVIFSSAAAASGAYIAGAQQLRPGAAMDRLLTLRVPVTPDMIVNHANGRQQEARQLALNTF